MRLPNERFSCTFSTTLIVAGVVVGRLEEGNRKSVWEERTCYDESHIRVFKDLGQWRDMSTPSNRGHGKELEGGKTDYADDKISNTSDWDEGGSR